MQVEPVAGALGKERLFSMMNEVFRLSGAHDLKLETDEADDADEDLGIANEQFLEKLREQWPAVLQTLQKLMVIAQQAQASHEPHSPEAPPGAPPLQPEQQPIVEPDQKVMT